jgi:hypothetical protein
MRKNQGVVAEPYCKWEDEDWDTLIYAIKKKNCILMLGPDTAVETVNGQPRLLTESLANQLAGKIEPVTLARINKSDLAQVSQYYPMDRGREDGEALKSRPLNFMKKKRTFAATYTGTWPHFLSILLFPPRLTPCLSMP